MLAAQRALGVAGDTTKTGVKELAPVDYRWNSYLVQQIIGKETAAWESSLAAFNALDPAEQTDWTAEAETLGIPEVSIPYAGDPPIPAGAALFALSRTLYHLGIHAATGAPDGTNAAAWATIIAS